jgi:hypothetical protein
MINNLRYLDHIQALNVIGFFCCRFLMHKVGTIYDYARVSTDAQDLSRTGLLRAHVRSHLRHFSVPRGQIYDPQEKTPECHPNGDTDARSNP